MDKKHGLGKEEPPYKNKEWLESELRSNIQPVLLVITPRKTGREVMPELRDDLKRHFIRGFFDGDGSVEVYQNTLKMTMVSASYNILFDVYEYINSTLGVGSPPKKKTRYEKRFFDYVLHSKNAPKTLNHLYEDSTIHLSRKRAIFQPYNFNKPAV